MGASKNPKRGQLLRLHSRRFALAKLRSRHARHGFSRPLILGWHAKRAIPGITLLEAIAKIAILDANIHLLDFPTFHHASQELT